MKERVDLRAAAKEREREYREKVERDRKEEEERLADFDEWAGKLEEGEGQ